MKRALCLFLLVIASSGVCLAQVSGNIVYSQQSGQRSERARSVERSKRMDLGVPSMTSMYVEANVLMNVKADQHVALFGVMQECATVPDCNRKMDATIGEFSGALRQLGIGADDVYVDYAAQTKIYGYELGADNVAREKLVGFELKKNVSVRYADKLLLDKLVVAASRAGIYDLIKVDYVVSDTNAVNQRLFEEAAKIIKQKVGRHEQFLNIKLRQPAQVHAEKPGIYYPTEMYDSYTAAETEDIRQAHFDRQRYVIHAARKSRTFFFNPLDAEGFDQVINPVVIEPVVQFTLYVRMKYEMEQQLAR